MTLAQQRLAVIVAWTIENAAPWKTPLGDKVIPGPWCVWIPLDLDAVPDDSDLHREHLPIFIPSAQALGGSVPVVSRPTEPPNDQTRVAARLRHLVFRFGADVREFRGALIPIERGETLRTALDRAFPAGLDLDAVPALFLPLWKLEPERRAPHFPEQQDRRAWARRALPLIRV